MTAAVRPLDRILRREGMMNRREFLKIGGGGALGAGILGGLSTDWYGAYGNPVEDPGSEGEKVVPSFCELCFWKCGVLAHVKNGRVTKIKGNPKHPLSRGRLCPRGAGATPGGRGWWLARGGSISGCFRLAPRGAKGGYPSGTGRGRRGDFPNAHGARTGSDSELVGRC